MTHAQARKHSIVRSMSPWQQLLLEQAREARSLGDFHWNILYVCDAVNSSWPCENNTPVRRTQGVVPASMKFGCPIFWLSMKIKCSL